MCLGIIRHTQTYQMVNLFVVLFVLSGSLTLYQSSPQESGSTHKSVKSKTPNLLGLGGILSTLLGLLCFQIGLGFQSK